MSRIFACLFLILAAPPAGRCQVQWRPYDLTTADGVRAVEIGRLRVPESRDKKRSRQVDLAFVRLRSSAAKPAAPVVYLAGGPGGSGIAAAAGPLWPAFQQVLKVADILLPDQRGAGLARPSLACPQTWSLDLAKLRTADSLLPQVRRLYSECLEPLRRQGVDLAAYNTRESAADLEDLRTALGVRRMSLLGYSYGTHLALAYLRRYGGNVERAVLAGVEGPDHTLKLPSRVDAVLRRALALADEAAPGSQPLEQTLLEVLQRLEQQPAAVDLGSGRVTISAFDVRLLAAYLLQGRGSVQRLPPLIEAMAGGDFRSAAETLSAISTQRVFPALAITSNCASGATQERWRRILDEESRKDRALAGRLSDFPLPDICDVTGGADLGDEFRSPVRSDVPALLISGTLDARTPPENAGEVLAGFSRGSHVVIEHAGHADLFAPPEIHRAIAAFYRGEPPQLSRLQLPPLSFPGRQPDGGAWLAHFPAGFLGTWEVDKARSDFAGRPAPRRLTFSWSRDDSGIEVFQTGVDAKGRPSQNRCRPIYDGKPQPPNGPYEWDSVVNEVAGPRQLKDTFYRAGRAIGTIERTLSVDGRTMTVTARFGSGPRQALVLVKQTGK